MSSRQTRIDPSDHSSIMEGGGCTAMATSGDWERLLSVIQRPDEKDNERVFAFEEEESYAATASASEPDNESELGLFNTPSAPVMQKKPTPATYESHTSLFIGDTDTNSALGLGIDTTEDIKPTPIYWNALSFFNNSTLAASALASLGALPTNQFSTLGSKSLHEAVVITPHYGNQEDKLPIVSGSGFMQQDKGSINMGRCVQVKPKYGRKFCKVEGCTSYAQKKGVCCRHGASFTKKKCKTLGCTNQVVKNGLCVAHGANRKRKICSHNGCSTFVVSNNLCIRHGAKVVRKQCSQEGCSSCAQKGGVCKKHYPK